jgi:hypothetical protein
MNYRHRALKVVNRRPAYGLVDAIAQALRRAEFEGAKIATLTAANNAANYIEQLQKRGAHLSIDRMEALRVILAGAYVPPRVK